jgi:cytochrome P450
MVELLQNPNAMAKAQEELSRVLGSVKNIEESDIGQLPYLQAVVKETFRLHPAAPLLLPRDTHVDTKIMGHTIPKCSRVFVNVWAMGRDTEVWPESEKFMRERFLGRMVDLRGETLTSSHSAAGAGSAPECRWLLGWCIWFSDHC